MAQPSPETAARISQQEAAPWDGRGAALASQGRLEEVKNKGVVCSDLPELSGQ